MFNFWVRTATFFGILAVLLHVLPSPPRVSLFSKRHRLNSQTTFLGFNKCNASETEKLIQAHKDALILAEAALEDDKELSTTGVAQYIDFDTVAAIQFFGPPDQNAKWRQRIFDTLYRATKTYRGWGLSDWWYQRYVDVGCSRTRLCMNERIYAYTQSKRPGEEGNPRITYCPAFFEDLETYSDMMERVKNAGPDTRKNVLNMNHQGSIALHEWLHIANSPAEVCQGGCKDIFQTIGHNRFKTYAAGASKILAQRNVKSAAYNNDNYVYFALAKHMEKTFGEYPIYPTAWDPNKSYWDNLRDEEKEPGYRHWSESTDPPSEEDEIVSDALYPESDYPKWYRPILRGKGRDSPPNLFEPVHIPFNFSKPHIHDVVCETSRHSGSIMDCVNAFEKLYANPEAVAKKGRLGGWNWEGHTQSCAIAVNYTGDWSNCEANLGDIQAHASTIFESCQDGCRRTVGGYVPFSLTGCPGTISIIPTTDRRPPGESLYTFIKDQLKDRKVSSQIGSGPGIYG